MTSTLQAVLFDKDGTLIDFHATWDRAIGAALQESSADQLALEAAADALGYDLQQMTTREDSIFIAEANDVILAALAPHVDVQRFGEVCMRVADTSVSAADGLPELLHSLHARSIGLGVVTNDWEEIAAEQIETLGWSNLFNIVLGSNSGFGSKPQPGMLLEAARRLGADPAATAMVGDTAHDLKAGRAAGMLTVLVTGSGGHGQPTPQVLAYADIVVTSLGLLEAELVARDHLTPANHHLG